MESNKNEKIVNNNEVLSPYVIDVKVGNDNGNSEHDIIINGKQICSPNVLAKVRKVPMLDEINRDYVTEHIEDKLIVTVDSPSAMPGVYFIGNYALSSGEKVRSIEVGADNNKVESEIVIINTLAQIAGYAVQEIYKEDKKIDQGIFVNTYMTTALPISQYSKGAAERFSQKFMNGNHKITVNVGTLRVDVTINFKFVKVIPEGVTAVHAVHHLDDIMKENNAKFEVLTFNSGKEEKKNINSDYFKDKKILHLGIGEGTTELPVTDDIVFNPNFIRGINNGIGHAIDRSLDEFKNELGLRDYSRQKYSQVLRDQGHKQYPIASEIISTYIDDEAEEILHAAKTEIQKTNNEVDIIMVYGGGSIPMREQLESKLKGICEKGKIDLFYVPENFAVTLESIGLYKFTTGKIFEALLKKHNSK